MKKAWFLNNTVFEKVSTVFFYFSILTILMQIVGIGTKMNFNETYFQFFKATNFIFAIFSVFISIYIYLREIESFKKGIKGVFIGISVFYLIAAFEWMLDTNFLPIDSRGNVIFFSIFIAFLSISQKLNNISYAGLHPTLVFILSFVTLILCGSFLLMLPASTTNGIKPLDAVFTATSGVTVTGLTVVDTEIAFTDFGKWVLIIMIQLGGLGVLTFTNLFSLLFKSNNSFTNRLMVSDMIKELNNSNTFTTLGRIIVLTVVVELLGTLLIYISIVNNPKIDQKVFFSVFHAISGFCNAGFSTLSNGLYDESIRFNYFFQLIITWLVITGGISYSVMINHNKIIGSKLNKIFSYLGLKSNIHNYTKVNTNNKLIVITSFSLLIIGSILFYINEYNNTLREHGFWGKIVISFFNSVTPRTAGFNVVNMSELAMPSILICMFLMWIGASPGSTGGGIKTTTFAIVCMNLYNQIRGRTKLIYNWREIPIESINQANAVIFLSIVAIGTSTLLLSFLEKDFAFKDILYEVISAYSTVGLSMGITPKLSSASKVVLIITMFLGRVSFLTILIGLYRQFFEQHKREVAQYPKDNVFIN